MPMISADPFARLRRRLALQHRDCVQQSEDIQQVRAMIARTRELLAELDANSNPWTSPFAWEPSKERNRQTP